MIKLKNLFFLMLISAVHASFVDCSYMNDEGISFKTILTGDRCTSIDYNILSDAQGHIGGDRRILGIHDMSIEIPGYEVVHLVKDDVCLHPSLFTMLSLLFRDDNMFVQRWACVKWYMPLSFGFKVRKGELKIMSSIWKYRFLSWLRAEKWIELVKTSSFDEKKRDKDLTITVSVNGRTVVVEQKTVVQIYSMSAIQASIIPYIFWPLL